MGWCCESARQPVGDRTPGTFRFSGREFSPYQLPETDRSYAWHAASCLSADQRMDLKSSTSPHRKPHFLPIQTWLVRPLSSTLCKDLQVPESWYGIWTVARRSEPVSVRWRIKIHPAHVGGINCRVLDGPHVRTSPSDGVRNGQISYAMPQAVRALNQSWQLVRQSKRSMCISLAYLYIFIMQRRKLSFERHFHFDHHPRV